MLTPASAFGCQPPGGGGGYYGGSGSRSGGSRGGGGGGSGYSAKLKNGKMLAGTGGAYVRVG